MLIGWAVKCMNEMIGLFVSIIYCLLGLIGCEKNLSLIVKELEGGLLIVDEMFMVDIWLVNMLLKVILINM